MITAIVVDDESISGQWLGLKLNETGIVQVSHIIQNPLELMELIREKKVDVVFLDIEMPLMTGLELAEQLKHLENSPEVVFVTAYNQYAVEAFKVNALDYLLKPVNDMELQRVLEKLIKRLGKQEKYSNEKLWKVKEQIYLIPDIKLDFSTAKCEELFYYMLLKNRRPISKWEIIENLWPGKEPDKGEANLRTTIFRLNQTLEKAGMDLRVKAIKGYYHFIHSSTENEKADVQLLPPADALKDMEASIIEILQKYDFVQTIEKKDYLWTVTIKQYEMYYYHWAMQVIKHYEEYEAIHLQALNYLLERFPWQEPLIIKIMPLILKVQGKGSFIRFYQEQQKKWNVLYNISLSKKTRVFYENLLRDE